MSAFNGVYEDGFDECPECDGTGKDPGYDAAEAEDLYGPEETRSVTAPNGECPVCCGFGRLDW